MNAFTKFEKFGIFVVVSSEIWCDLISSGF